MPLGVIISFIFILLGIAIAYKWMFNRRSKVCRVDLTSDVGNLSYKNKSVDKCNNFFHGQYAGSLVKWLFILTCGGVWVSIPWEFMLLYQKAVADRASQIVQVSI